MPTTPRAGDGAARPDWWTEYVKSLPWWIRFFLPFVFAPLPLYVAHLFLPQAVGKVASMLAIIVFAIDVAVITGLSLDLVWWVVFGTAVWVELWIILWIVSNLEALRRWRPAGRFFARQERKAERMYRRSEWVRRFHFWGVVIVTFLPLGSGVILGTLLSKFTGMGDRRAIAAVFIGTVMWVGFLTLVFALSLDAIKEWIERLPGHETPEA